MTDIIEVKLSNEIGDFGENKDIAKRIRIKKIMPGLIDNAQIVLDFNDVSGATQSFIHALIAEPMREFPDLFFSNVKFKNCQKTIKTVVMTVSEYIQESMDNGFNKLETPYLKNKKPSQK